MIPIWSDAAKSTGQSLADHATSVLRDRLIFLDIPPGSPINDEIVGRELGVGRTPVREALKRLETEHLVTVYPRRGTFASVVDITELAQISEIRAQLEPLAASRASRFSSPEQRSHLTELRDALRDSSATDADRTRLMRVDLDVHRMIYAANGNKHLEEVLVTYDNLSTRIWCLVVDRLPRLGEHVEEHIDLLTAIVDGRTAEAHSLALEHVLSFETAVRSVL